MLVINGYISVCRKGMGVNDSYPVDDMYVCK